jgi:hypothetical protein
MTANQSPYLIGILIDFQSFHTLHGNANFSCFEHEIDQREEFGMEALWKKSKLKIY